MKHNTFKRKISRMLTQITKYISAVFLKSCKNIMLVCSLENVMSEMEMSVALLNNQRSPSQIWLDLCLLLL